MANEDDEITFTLLLYGVIIANILFRARPTLAPRNAIILASFIFIISDWIDYKIDFDEKLANASGWRYIYSFVLDIIVLIVWYTAALTKPPHFTKYFALITLFFYTQLAWDIIILRPDTVEILKSSYLQVAVFFTIFTGIVHVTTINPILVLAVATVAFILRKAFEWKEVINENPEAL